MQPHHPAEPRRKLLWRKHWAVEVMPVQKSPLHSLRLYMTQLYDFWPLQSVCLLAEEILLVRSLLMLYVLDIHVHNTTTTFYIQSQINSWLWGLRSHLHYQLLWMPPLRSGELFLHDSNIADIHRVVYETNWGPVITSPRSLSKNGSIHLSVAFSQLRAPETQD